MCPKFGMPHVRDYKKSTYCARLPRWWSELHDAFIMSVDGKLVATIEEYEAAIADARKNS